MTKQNSVDNTPKQPEKKFITSMELNSLKIRKSIVDMKKHEAFLLEGEMQMYVSGLLAKYETDNTKMYNISIETGEITEQKSEK